MFNAIRKKKIQRAILSMRVDFMSKTKENYGDLEPGRSFFLGKQEKEISYEQIRDYLIEAVETDMKNSLQKISDLEIQQIRVENDYSGSIELVLSILFGAFSVISGYKSFYDNITLLKNQSRKYIQRKLKNEFRIDFDVSTEIEYPIIERYYPEDFFFRFAKRGFFPFSYMSDQKEANNRDGFFYYLLVSNVLLFIIIGALIYKAVLTQFGW